MAFQAVTHSLPLPRGQSNWSVFGVPSLVRLHEYKPQKLWCLKKKSSGHGAEDRLNLKCDTGDSKEESGSATIASEDYIKTRNGKALEDGGSLEALVKLLLVEAATRKDMIAAQEQMIVDLQKRVSPSSELTAAQEQMTADLQRRVSPSSELTSAQDQRILVLQKRVEELEFAAAQQQMIADLQKKVAQLEMDAESKSKTETPPTEIHAQSKSKRKTLPREIHIQSKSKSKTNPTMNHVSGDDETDERREMNSRVYFPASSDKEEHTGVDDDYAMAAMNALKRMQLDLNAESKSKRKTNAEPKSKRKTNPTVNHVSRDGETDEHLEMNSLVYYPASSDKEEPTGVDDDYAMAAMNALKRMQLDLNAESKSKTKTPPTENHVSGDGEIDKQRERNPLYFPASSDKEEQSGVVDDYATAAMNALKTMQLDLNAESKSKMKTRSRKNHVSGDGETDEQRERNPLVYYPASSNKEEDTGGDDDYTMAAMKALQRMQLDLNAESKSKSKKTPPTKNHVSGSGKTDEQRERNPLVYFPTSDKEEHTGVDDDYTTAAMKALQKMQLDLNAESKSKIGTSLKTPQTEILVPSDDETDEEELSSNEDEQREKTPLVNFSASSDGEEEQSGFKDDYYTTAVMNVLLRTQVEQNAESESKTETPLRTPQTEVQLSDGETDEEEHSSDIDEQSERTYPAKFSASSDEETHAGYKDDKYSNAVMNQISKPPKMRFNRKARKM